MRSEDLEPIERPWVGWEEGETRLRFRPDGELCTYLGRHNGNPDHCHEIEVRWDCSPGVTDVRDRRDFDRLETGFGPGDEAPPWKKELHALAPLKPGDRVLVQNVPRSDFPDGIPGEWATPSGGSTIFPEPTPARVVQKTSYGVRIELEGGWRCWVPRDCVRFVQSAARAAYEPPAVTHRGETVLPPAALRATLNLRQAVQQLAIAYEMAVAAERSELAAIGLMATLEDTRRLAGRLERLAIDCGEPDSADSILSAECETRLTGVRPVRDRLCCTERRARFARFVVVNTEGVQTDHLALWFDLQTETALLLDRDTRLVNVEPSR
jgi:hypothetical protein